MGVRAIRRPVTPVIVDIIVADLLFGHTPQEAVRKGSIGSPSSAALAVAAAATSGALRAAITQLDAAVVLYITPPSMR